MATFDEYWDCLPADPTYTELLLDDPKLAAKHAWESAAVESERCKVLLMAAYQILKKCNDSHYVQNVMGVTADYDGTECDGYCLMEDIEIELELGAYAP